MTAQPPKIHSKPLLELLIDNIARLRHPAGIIKHPYFDETFAANKDGVRDMKRKFCEAFCLLMQDNPELLIPIMTAGGYKCVKSRKTADV
jgi:hypothetical protein